MSRERCWALSAFPRVGVEVANVTMIGGAAKSRSWAQMIADATETTVYLQAVSEAACRGAAILAGLGVGIIKDLKATAATLERRKGVAFFADVCDSFGYNPYEFSRQVYRRLYPEQAVEALHFGYPFREADLAELIQEHSIAGLYMPRPDAQREELERAVGERGFLGFKPYPDLVYGKTRPEIRIGDCISPAV